MIYDSKPHTLRETLKVAVSFLSEQQIKNAQNDVFVMLQHILALDKHKLLLAMDEIIESDKLNQLETYLLARVQGKPLQYITGKQEFMSLNFKVTPGVLIPRPETEVLVEKAIELCKGFLHTPKIVDICTGSGCIIISICYYVKKGIFLAGDISLEALQIARENATSLGLGKEIKFIKSDLLDNPAYASSDLIISNPPYIAAKEIPTLQREVSCYEPVLALDGGVDGLEVYRRLIPQAYGCLNSKGWFIVEIGCEQAAAVSGLYQAAGFTEVQVLQDYSGLDRIVLGRK